MPPKLSGGGEIYILSKNILFSTKSTETKPTQTAKTSGIRVFSPPENFATLTIPDGAARHTY